MVTSNPNQNDLNLDGQKTAGDPTKAWTELLSTNTDEGADALTTGSDGSIYIAGTTLGNLDGQANSGGSDAFLTKYNVDGTKDWTQLLGTNAGDGASAVTTGSDGSIYIAGITQGDLDGETNNGLSDAFLTKYDPDGTKDWTQLLGTTSWDAAHALTTGSDGSIYIAGITQGDLDGETNNGRDDAFLTKYNADGTKDWTQILGSTSTDYGNALTTGSDGSIYIAGFTTGNLDGETNSGSRDAYLTKYDPDGTKDWTQLLGTTSVDGAGANALTTGSDGSIYMAGYTRGELDGKTNSGSDDAFLTKYNADGTKNWTQLLGSTSGDYGNALTTGSDGSIYIAGRTAGDLDGETNSGIADAFLTKYDPDGTKEWTQLLGSTSGDSANALTPGSDGSIYIAGTAYDDLDGQWNSGGQDAFLTKFIDHSISINNESNEPNIIKLGDGDVYLRGDSLYTIVNGEQWEDAEVNSVKLGGNLVTINDESENQWLHKAFEIEPKVDSQANPLTEPTWLYTGFNDVAVEGDWKWSSGESVTYTNWWGSDWNAPVEGWLSNPEENYMHLGFISPDKWNDTSNNGTVQNRGGIAEIPVIRNGDSAYVVVEGPTWEEAEANAQKLGGNLVTINNSQEQQWLNDNFAAVNPGQTGGAYHRRYYIGLTDRKTEGTYEWTSGEPLTYTNWFSPGEPNGDTYNTEDDYTEFMPVDWEGSQHGAWNDLSNNMLETVGNWNAKTGIAEIKIPQDKIEISYELRKAKRKDGSSSTETDGIALETDVDTTIREDPLKSTAIKGIGATDNDAYILDILAKNVAQGYTLESTDITLKFNTDLFGSIDKDQIQLSSLFPVANAIHIDNTKGEIRIAGAGLNHLTDAGAGIASGENKVFASIALNFDETALAKYTTGSATAGKLLTYDGTASDVDAFDGTLEFDLSVNRDSTVFSKSITETSGLENAEISTLRDLNGSVKAIKDSIALYEGQVDLSQTGDLTFASNRTIGVASGGIKTNLIRAGSTVYSDVTWKNTGNVAATDITIKNLATEDSAVGKVISSKSGFLKTATTTSTDYSKNGILDQTALDQIDATNNKLKGGSFVTTSAEEVNGLKIGDYDPNKQEEKTVRIAVEIGDDQAGKVFNAGKNLYRMEVIRKDQHGKDQTDEYDVGTNVGSKNLITFQGDLNFDGTVGMKDLAFLNAGAARQTLKDVTSGMKDNLGNDIGTQTKQAEANTYASDVDADFNGVIDIADLKILDKDWGKTLHTGEEAFHGISNGTTVGDNQISWADLNGQTGINESWDNTSFEKQNTLEAKASSGGYDAPLEHVQNTNTSNSNIDSDNAARDEVVTGGTNNPNPSVSGGGGNYTEDITGTGLNDDIMGGSST